MREYGKVMSSLWRSRKFRSLESDDARLLYLYLHTCTHGNSVGCFVLPIGYIQADLRWPEKAITKAIESLSEAHLIAFDSEEEVVRIIDFLKHDTFTNTKHAAGAVKAAISLPDCDEKLIVLNELAADRFASQVEGLAEAIDSLSKGSRTPTPIPTPINPSSLRSEGFVAADATTPPDDDPADGSADEVREAVDAYNRVAEAVGLPRVQKLTNDRRTKLRARLRDCGGMEGWRFAMEKLAASPHCRGENDRGWRADFDFVVSESRFTRLMEGRYDSHGPPAASRRGGIVQAAEMAKEMMRREAEQWEH